MPQEFKENMKVRTKLHAVQVIDENGTRRTLHGDIIGQIRGEVKKNRTEVHFEVNGLDAVAYLPQKMLEAAL